MPFAYAHFTALQWIIMLGYMWINAFVARCSRIRICVWCDVAWEQLRAAFNERIAGRFTTVWCHICSNPPEYCRIFNHVAATHIGPCHIPNKCNAERAILQYWAWWITMSPMANLYWKIKINPISDLEWSCGTHNSITTTTEQQQQQKTVQILFCHTFWTAFDLEIFAGSPLDIAIDNKIHAKFYYLLQII